MLKSIEELRSQGLVGSSLQAECSIKASGKLYAELESLGEELRFVMMTSSAALSMGSAGEDLVVETRPSTQKKCERCWHYVCSVGEDPQHPGLCSRCRTNLFGLGEVRKFA